MSHLDWIKVDGATRGTPRRVHTRRGGHRLALGLLSCMALVLSGCQSGPFSNGGCKTCGGFFTRATNRILHRDKGGCCGSSGVSEGVVEYGGSSSVVVPGAVPSYQSGGIMGTSPSNVSPPIDRYAHGSQSGADRQAGSASRKRAADQHRIGCPCDQLLAESHQHPANESDAVEHAVLDA